MVVKSQTGSTPPITHYLHSDHLGSTALITDDQGLKNTALQYYPYGKNYLDNPQPATRNSITDKQYTGQRKDSSSDLYFYNARYYNSQTAHFISADKAEGPNRYAYVQNNPIMKNDPSGNDVNNPGEKYYSKKIVNKILYPQNNISFTEKISSVGYFNSTTIKNDISTKDTIALLREVIINDPKTKHAYLNAANNNDLKKEFLPVLVDKINKFSKYNEIIAKGDTDPSYFTSDFNLRVTKNKGVCMDYGLMTDIQLKEFGFNESKIIRDPLFVASMADKNGEDLLPHVFNIVDNDTIIDSTWNIVMFIEEHVKWIRYIPQSADIFQVKDAGNYMTNDLPAIDNLAVKNIWEELRTPSLYGN